MNFYKITNEKENHRNLQYKTGLNADILPWNPKGDCEKGGIYFAREDILAFMGYGYWIRKVIIPEGTDVYENPGNPKKWKAHKIILGKREKIGIDVIKKLLKQGANIHANDDSILMWASKNGHFEVVKLLLEHGADIHTGDDCSLTYASENGHFEVVKFLLEYGANAHGENDCALVLASKNGYFEIVKLLLEHGAENDWALGWARKNKHLEIVNLFVEKQLY